MRSLFLVRGTLVPSPAFHCQLCDQRSPAMRSSQWQTVAYIRLGMAGSKHGSMNFTFGVGDLTTWNCDAKLIA